MQFREAKFNQYRAYERANDDYVGIRFDEDLTHAVLAGFDGLHAAAIQLLENALNDSPTNSHRTVDTTEQIVNIAKYLFIETRDANYRSFFLDLSRRIAVVRPMSSWPHLVVAEYGETDAERIRAISSALYLDRRSALLAKLPADLVADGQHFLDDNGPAFLLRRHEDKL